MGIRDLKNNLSRYLKKVQAGERIVVTDRGRPVAESDEILLRAGRDFPAEPLRTLDAIHLATVVSSGMPARLVRVVTRDRRVRANAIAMGYAVG